jgi:hypothetical protein
MSERATLQMTSRDCKEKSNQSSSCRQCAPVVVSQRFAVALSWPIKIRGSSFLQVLQGASITLHTILLGVGCIIYDNHTLEPFKELGFDPQKVRNLLPSFVFILSITLPNMSIPDVPFPALLSTLIRGRFQVKPATLLMPIELSFSFGGGLLRYQSGSFSLISNVGSDFSLPVLYFLHASSCTRLCLYFYK